MDSKDVKKIVKDKYSQIAASSGCGCCCGGGCGNNNAGNVSKEIGYTNEDLKEVGGANLGLGCGNPIAFGSIKEGDTVLDLGSGAGIDCVLAAKKVGSTGQVIGVDMTEEMIEKAQINVFKAGLKNISFRLGDIEDLPVDNDSVDIVISNCVINLAPDKDKVFAEIYRVLKPGGKVYVSDIVLLEELSPEQKNDPDLLSGCVAGALLKDDYLKKLETAGFKINVLNENKEISKTQYQGIPLESLTIETVK